MPGLDKGLAPDMVLSGLDEVFFSKFNEEPMPNMARVTDDLIFKQDNTDRSGIITEQMEDGGLWAERKEKGDLEETTIRAGNKKTHTVVAFAQSLPISKHYFDDEQYGTVNEAVSKMGMKGRLTRRKEGFGTYRGAFTTTLTNEGTALCSASHTNLNGDTVNNLETAALTETSLNTMINGLVEQVDQRGDNVGYEASCLFVPNKLFKLATEILESKLQQGTTDNDMNIYSDKYSIYLKQSNWIGATNGGSDTAYFLLSGDHTVKRWERQAIVTDLVDYKYSDNFTYKYKAEFREVYGAISYEGLFGSTGLT